MKFTIVFRWLINRDLGMSKWHDVARKPNGDLTSSIYKKGVFTCDEIKEIKLRIGEMGFEQLEFDTTPA
jgi:hypothetical protein